MRFKPTIRQIAVTAAGCLSVCLSLCAQAEPVKYPETRQSDLVETHFGIRVPDPYRWLEEIDSSETQAFVRQQSAVTDHYLGSLHGRPQLRKRLAQLYRYERFGIPFQAGGHYFFTRNSGQQDQSVLYSATSLTAKPRVALDPNRLSSDGHLAVVGYVPSHDGEWFAYGVSESGSDWTEWRIRQTTTGVERPEVIRYTKYYAPVFSNDDRGMYYSAFQAPLSGTELEAQDVDNAVFFHFFGTDTATDVKVFAQSEHADWQYEPSISADGKWLIIAAGEGQVGDKGVENIYAIDLTRTGTAQAVPLFENFEAAYMFAGSDQGLLYFVTTRDAPNGKIIAVDPIAPAEQRWRTVIAEGNDAISITEKSAAIIGHRLIVRSLHDAHSQVTVYHLDGTTQHVIPLPGPGTVHGFDGLPQDQQSFYSFTDLITPATVYRYDLTSGNSTLFKAPRVAFDPARFEERQVFYRAKDGTRIPMLLAYRKGLTLNGLNPTLLYAYGGFGIPTLPAFNASHIAWLEMGGVYAMANIRGGGEYGDAWHRQAIRENKQIVFDDFIAAAEWLISEHYTSTAKLAIEGRSNGGLLMGACITQRPDLFGAAIAQVGVMDMLRFDRFGQGAGWTGDYGSPQDPNGFKALLAYSPVHNVKRQQHYPATLIVTGDHDTRVMPAHSFKFAAAMQAAQSGPAPILLMIEKSSGHGGGPTVTQAIDQATDVYTFLMNNLRMSPIARHDQPARGFAATGAH
jgi:prolyl oligopeptidase